MNITQQELEQAWNAHRFKLEGCKEDYFALLYLAKKFKRKVEDIAPQVAFGGHDYGFDAFYIDANRRTLYLFQFKWSKNHMLFKESLERLTTSGLERVFAAPNMDKQEQDLLPRLRYALKEDKAAIDTVRIQFVFNGDTAAVEKSDLLDWWRDELEKK